MSGVKLSGRIPTGALFKKKKKVSLREILVWNESYPKPSTLTMEMTAGSKLCKRNC